VQEDFGLTATEEAWPRQLGCRSLLIRQPADSLGLLAADVSQLRIRRTVRSWSVFLLSSFQAAKVPGPLVSWPGYQAAFPSARPGVRPGQGTRYLLAIQTAVKVPEKL